MRTMKDTQKFQNQSPDQLRQGMQIKKHFARK